MLQICLERLQIKKNGGNLQDALLVITNLWTITKNELYRSSASHRWNEACWSCSPTWSSCTRIKSFTQEGNNQGETEADLLEDRGGLRRLWQDEGPQHANKQAEVSGRFTVTETEGSPPDQDTWGLWDQQKLQKLRLFVLDVNWRTYCNAGVRCSAVLRRKDGYVHHSFHRASERGRSCRLLVQRLSRCTNKPCAQTKSSLCTEQHVTHEMKCCFPDRH